MKTIRGAAAALLISTLALTACSGSPALEVTTNPPAVEATPTPSETPSQAAPAAAERGTRSNPLAVGESRKISELSMWTVGATGPTDVREGYVSLPIQVAMDWDAGRAQLVENGQSASAMDEEGVNPGYTLFITFVAANGTSYSTLDVYPDDLPKPQLYEVGTVFPPAESVTATVSLSVPAENVAGGVWQVRNSAGETLYLSQ